MFVIIGIVIVIGAILGGYLMEHGNIRVLVQPAELLIIGGAALGTVLIATPLYILKKIVGGTRRSIRQLEIWKGPIFGKPEDAVRAVFAGPQGRADGAGIGQRRSGAEPGVFQ